MVVPRQKFSSQADPTVLVALRLIADTEGRQFQAVVEDAMRLYIEAKKQQSARPHVLSHFQTSLQQNRELGRLLAQ